MKILFTTATYYPSVNGVAISIANSKKELERKGHTVAVLAPDNPKKNGDEKNILRYSSMSNPFNSDYPLPLMPGLKVLFKLAEYKTFDVVHCHHPFNVGYFSRLLAQQYHAPLVFSYHTRYDIYANHYLKFLPKFMKNYLIEKSIKNFCRKTNL